MKRQTRIAVVGDYDPGREYHRATNEALEHAAAALGVSVLGDWLPTDSLDACGAAADSDGAAADSDGAAENGLAAASAKLRRYDAVFLAPGAPYKSREGAFAAIRFAREQGWPFFGT